MKITFYKVRLKKRFPLAISRGVRSDSENLFVRYDKEGITGWGEAAPGKSEGAESVIKVKQALKKFISTGINNFSIQELYDRSRELKTPPCAYVCLLYTSPSPRDMRRSRMPSSA